MSSHDSNLTIKTFYQYTPTTGILIAACVVFGIELAIVLAQFARSRANFMLWVALFVASEMGGYIAYTIFTYNVTLNAYLAELIILILGPNIVNLVNYSVVSRIAKYSVANGTTTTKGSFVARYAKWIPYVFVTSDLLCLTIQGIGGSQLSSAHHNGQFIQSKFDLGRSLTLAGIGAQLGFTFMFLGVSIYVYKRMCDQQLNTRLRYTWWCVAATMTLVTMRNIYRVVEFAGGQYSTIDSTEIPYMTLDLLLMVICGAVFIVLDLGRDAIFPVDVRNGDVTQLPTKQDKLDDHEATNSDINLHSPTAELSTNRSEVMV